MSYQATTCPAGARCEAVTYFEPTIAHAVAERLHEHPDRFRDFNGIELTFQKRMANRWSANVSYAYNNAIDHWDSADAYEDPTEHRRSPSGFQYAPESGGSGIGNVFQNSKWARQSQRPRACCRGTSTWR